MRGPGLRYRGRGSWPVLPRVIAGRWPWRLNGEEARCPAVAPDDVRDVAERVGQGMLNPCAGRDPTRSLTRRPDGFPGKGPTIFVLIRSPRPA